MASQKVLCTGGAGFISSHLVDQLIKDGYEVSVIDNLSSGKYENINPKAHFYKCDIVEDTDELASIFRNEKFDYVFHLAAHINLRDSIKNPAYDAYQNIVGTLNVLSLSAENNVKKFIFASTGGAIYKPNYASLPWNEIAATEPESPYGLAKLTAEKYIELQYKRSKLDYVVLRLSNVYGPRQAGGESGVISIFFNNLKNKKDFDVYGDGKNTRDFVNVFDVTNAFKLAINLPNGIYNVSTQIETSIYELMFLIRKFSKQTVNVNYMPAIPGEMIRSCLNNLMLRSYGWKPNIDLNTGIQDLIRYYKI